MGGGEREHRDYDWDVLYENKKVLNSFHLIKGKKNRGKEMQNGLKISQAKPVSEIDLNHRLCF